MVRLFYPKGPSPTEDYLSKYFTHIICGIEPHHTSKHFPPKPSSIKRICVHLRPYPRDPYRAGLRETLPSATMHPPITGVTV
ncbi:MAG: hypothetical protein AVDCRST_MAG56-3172 [uncultured Cytophagales bacterium]|uniref:Uncharacterized protein n=1 Tax=uncultured Cytophagales bacterium TaxID=158755 RepID=A0A6J4JB79_9SPHI|nr:MAG: hypothetical protein AVDCRST_MAG56-3172 [uncultured Cytophagales bacterium]